MKPAQTYDVNTNTLTMSVVVSDTAGTGLTTGDLTWSLKDDGGGSWGSGALTYSDGAWRGKKIMTRGLQNGRFVVSYTYSGNSRSGDASASFTVGGAIDITGRITDGRTARPITGASITFGTASAISDSAGVYTISNVPTGSAADLKIGASGYAARTVSIVLQSGTQKYVQHVVLFAGGGSKPAILSVRGQYEGTFLAGIPVANKYTATVQWNGNPGTVVFRLGNSAPTTVTATGGEASAAITVGNIVGIQQLTVTATNREGVASDSFKKQVGVAELPGLLRSLLETVSPALTNSNAITPLAANTADRYLTALPNGAVASVSFSIQNTEDDIQICADLQIDGPSMPRVDVPLLGKWGMDLSMYGSFDYTVGDGAYEVAILAGDEAAQGKRGRRPKIPFLTRQPRTKWYIGNREVNFRVGGGFSGTLIPGVTATIEDLSARVGIDTKFEGGRVSPLDIFPGATTALSKFSFIEPVLRPISLIIYVKVGADVTGHFQPDPFRFRSVEGRVDTGPEAGIQPEVPFGIAGLSVQIGGTIGAVLQHPGDLIKEWIGNMYGEIKAHLGPFEGQYGCVWEIVKKDVRCGTDVPGSATTSALRPMNRSYLAEGGSRFLAGENTEAASATSRLEAFRKLTSQAEQRPNLNQRSAAEQQTELPLVENVYPYSQPVLATRGKEAMLLYVADNSSGGRLQFTDINWMYLDGTSWSSPAAILTDNRADFSPVVAFDGNGDAIAVWARIRSADFDSVDETAFASQLEVVWSRWSRQTRRWSEPAPLSSTSNLNFAPELAGPLNDGSLLLTWTENQANLFVPEGPPESLRSGRLLWSRWDSAQAVWSQPGVLIPGLTGRLSHSFGGTADTAVYAWSKDLDGNTSTESNQSYQEVFYVRWSKNAWGAPTRLTNDSIQDANVRDAVGDSGIWMTWQRGSDLVFDHDLAGQPKLVRPNSADLSFLDYVLTVGPSGRLAIVWQGAGQRGSNPWFRVFDQTSSTWSRFADALR